MGTTKYTDTFSHVVFSTHSKSVATMWLSWKTHITTHKGAEYWSKRCKALFQIGKLVRSVGYRNYSVFLPEVLATPKVERWELTPLHQRVLEIYLQVSEVARENHIALKVGFPRGVDGVIVRGYASATKPQTVRRHAAVLRGYGTVRLKALSANQLNKSRKSINVPSDQFTVKYQELRHECGDLGDRLIIQFPTSVHLSAGRKPVSCVNLIPYEWFKQTFGIKKHTGDPLPRVSMASLNGTSRYYLPRRIDKDVTDQPFGVMTANMLTMPWIPESLERCVQGPEVHVGNGSYEPRDGFELRKSLNERFKNQLLGKISCIQEPGAKARVICMPNFWIQYYMKPLHKELTRIIRVIEGRQKDLQVHGYSCVTNQVVGANFASAAMDSGLYVESVDLSSATDRFPLAYQQVILKFLGYDRYADAMSDLTGPYLGLDGEDWYYNQGQPMGMYASFPLFHLSHYLLLTALANTLYPQDVKPRFAVLGDDVIFADRNLATLYKAVMTYLDVPVQQTKCYSGTLSEFAGFDIEPGHVYKPLKYSSDSVSIPSFMFSLGRRCMSRSSLYRKWYPVFRETLKDRNKNLTPLFPQDKFGSSSIGSSKPSSKYIGSLINRLSYELNGLHERHMIAWSEERFSLLNETESLLDIGKVGVSTFDAFDPESYKEQSRNINDRYKLPSNWKMFLSDPVTKAYAEEAELNKRAEAAPILVDIPNQCIIGD